MVVVNADLVLYGSANHPNDDTSTAGGAISTVTSIGATELAANDTIDCLSDGADTRTVTITFRTAAGAIDTEAYVLTGATPVVGAKTMERIVDVSMSAGDASRTVTIRRSGAGATLITIAPDITAWKRLFRDAVSAGSGKDYYEKVFFQNDNATDTLLSAAVEMTAHGSGPTTIRMGLAAATGDTATITNRITAPGGISFVDEATSQSVPGGDLIAGEEIGIWMHVQLAVDNAAFRSSATLQCSGSSA